MTSLNIILNQFFEKVLFTPDSAIAKIPGIDLPSHINPEEISLENHHKFWEARKKLISFPTGLPVCQTLKTIGKAILTLPSATCPYPIQTHWQEILGEQGWHATQVNAILEHQNRTTLFPSLHFVANTLATYWLGSRKDFLGNDLSAAHFEEHLTHMLNISEYLAEHHPKGMELVSQLQVFITFYKKLTSKECDLNEMANLLPKMIMSLNITESLFVPLGWQFPKKGVNSKLLILQIEKQADLFYCLRLIMNTDELISTAEFETHDPAITWSHITKDQLTSTTLWSTIWEPFTSLQHLSNTTTYNEKWFIMALNHLLGKKCDGLINDKLSAWLKTCDLDESLPQDFKTPAEIQQLTPTRSGQGHPLWIAPSGLKPVKNSRYGNDLDKTLHKMAAIILHDPSTFNLWKIEQRLYIFVHLYYCLTEQRYPRLEMHDLIEIAVKAERKLWISIEKVALADKSPSSNAAILRIIATFLDVKTRFEKWLSQQDNLEFETTHSLYPRFIFPFKVNILSQPSQVGMTDVPIRQAFTIAPIHAEQFNFINESLLKWLSESYDFAKASVDSYRSSEWLALFTEAVYEKLPIPRKGSNCWTIVPSVNPEIIQDLMKTLYGLSCLLLYHAYSHEQILPQHLLHIYKIYRIQWALFQQVTPKAASCPISWIHFEKLLQSRGNDFFPQSIGETFYQLRESFVEVSP